MAILENDVAKEFINNPDILSISETTDKQNYYKKSYIPAIYKWGMITNTLGIIFAFIPAIILALVFKITPTFTMIVTGSMLQLMSGTLVSWIVDPIAMYPMLGMPGMFMSFLSGNISNLRLPALAAAQSAAQVEAGTEEGNVIATIGIAVSNIISLLLITGAVLGGSAFLATLPENVITTLNYILPALFGGIFGQFFMKNKILGIIAISLAVGLTVLVNLHFFDWLPFAPYNIVVIVAVFGTMLIGKLMADKELKQEQE